MAEKEKRMFFKLDTDAILDFITRPLEVIFLRYVLGIMILAPTLMLLMWYFSATHPLSIVLVNKSVPDAKRTEHAAVNWVLNHERIVNENDEFYDRDTDYYGFYPRLGGDFAVHDFSLYDSLAIDSLARSSDMLYLADSYGVYAHAYGEDKGLPNHLLYGGFNSSDLSLVKAVREKHKLIIGEFSLFGPPTPRSMRDSLSTLFGVEWSGWIGRYFVSLDTTGNDGLPPWVVKLYQDKHGDKWPFYDSGIVLVKNTEIVILEYGTHLLQEAPIIETQSVYANLYGLPASIDYPFWFDVVASPTRENQVISIFHLSVNSKGDSLLLRNKIPKLFPAVLKASSDEHPFYYFAGDFSDNPITPFLAYYSGIEWFQSFFYNKQQVDDRRQFFWRYYRPLFSHILNEEVGRKSQ